jgi:adenosylcobinamide amidohydrolase
LVERVEDGTAHPVLVWEAGPSWRMISSAAVGGGLGERGWWLNAGVPRDYARTDLPAHVDEIAAQFGLTGEGVGMLTAADVRTWTQAEDGGVHAVATVGLGLPVPAAAPAERTVLQTATRVGTINILVVLPVPLTDPALVNAVLTATEAKTQALVEQEVPGTGTSSDAVCIACPSPDDSRPPERSGGQPVEMVEQFCGPRSPWGARLARAVHAAVGEGTTSWLSRHHPHP